ncbi:MAG TPA: choice-of-anchor J domain-containing protein [Bacteroidia bacterium]|nr:choice-of-anchor J domain-containing protein [Bacteroidia bacterium]
MKRTFTLLLLAACSVFTVNSQTLLSDDFNATWNPATLGWTIINNSSPVGTTSVFQGNGASTFPAYNGGPNDYIGMNYNNTGSTGGISTWLITPGLTIYNGAVLQFATRTSSSTTTYPDRLQLRMSPVVTTSIPSGTTSVGTFTNLMLDINPNLSTANSSVVSNGTVNGYPQSWAVFTVQVTGITGTVTGCFALRYFVSNAGLNGSNSDYIGIDAFRYTLPCGPTVQSYTTCASASTTLFAVNGLPATTYSWNTGATTSSIVVSPGSTTTYSLFPANGTISCGSSVTSTITIASNLVVNISASSSTICSGNPVTLTAIAPATTFSWNTGATTAVITVTPNSNTTYSVGALNGGCFGGNTVAITVNASPSLSVSLTPACVGGSLTITASGANTYTYLGSSTNPQTIASPTAAGGYFFTLQGSNSNGCTASGVVNFTAYAPPVVTAIASKTIECQNKVITLTAGGASTYTWSGAATSTNASFNYTTSTTGMQTFNVIGTETTGCSASAAVNVSVTSCVGIAKNESNIEAAVFPNPFSNELNLSGLEGRIEIYNAIGQLVLSMPVNGEERLNTSEMARGAYILKVYNQEGVSTKTIKLMKN